MSRSQTYLADIVSTDEAGLTRALDILNEGGVVVIPTDTVYGVSAQISRREAIARLYEVKGRPEEKPIPVLVSSIEHAASVAGAISVRARRLMDLFWPGPLTIVIPVSSRLPVEITGTSGHVGLRMPNEPVILRLIERAGGAIAVTSANLSGQTEALTADEGQQMIGSRVDLILDGGRGSGGRPSTVVRVDCDGSVSILREGAISALEIHSAL